MKRCCKCGAEVTGRYIICPECYKKMELQVHAHWIQKVEPGGYIRTVCSKCGTEAALSNGKTLHNIYCDVCGAKMDEEAKDAEE